MRMGAGASTVVGLSVCLSVYLASQCPSRSIGKCCGNWTNVENRMHGWVKLETHKVDWSKWKLVNEPSTPAKEQGATQRYHVTFHSDDAGCGVPACKTKKAVSLCPMEPTAMCGYVCV